MNKLTEGIHYTIDENGRVVFTALFHIQRGSCCGNGCKHCPYDPKYQKGRVVLAEKFSKFTNMNLKDLEKQLQEIQNMDKNNLTPEQFQEMIDKLAFIAETGEQMLSNEIKTQIIKNEYDETNNS